MDGLVRNMAACAKKHLYLTAFKGYFPDLQTRLPMEPDLRLVRKQAFGEADAVALGGVGLRPDERLPAADEQAADPF